MNKKLLLVLAFLIVLSFCFVNYQVEIKLYIRSILEWKLLSTILWLYIIICYIIYFLANIDTKDNESGAIYKQFGTFANSAFAAITFGIASTTSAVILKGVYIQEYFGDKKYFLEFDNLDIYSILVVSMFLFGYSIIESFKSLLKGIMLQRSETVKPG